MTHSSKPLDPLSLAYRPSEEHKKKRLSFRLGRKSLGIGLGIVLLVAIGSGGFLYVHNQKTKETPDMIAQREADKRAVEAKKKADAMIDIVKKQIELPTNEEPILATVSDSNMLQNQDFFKDAKNGDRILLYPKHKKAYLYRPSEKKVLAVAPLQYNVGKSDTASIAGEQATPEEPTPDPNAPPNPTIVPHGKILIQPQR